MRHLLLFVFCLFLSGQSFAQNLERPQESFAAAIELPNVDSIPAPVKSTSRLLPQNMSLMERGLWGESGLFRSIGITGQLSPQTRQNEMAARRTMLTAHEIGGFVTFGLLATTVIYGQRMLNNNYDQYDQKKHNTFESLSIISYCTTALLSILSPPPLIRRDEVSTTSIHKLLAWMHISGMILTPIIGSRIKSRQTLPSGHSQTTYNDNTARFHQISAYTTTAIFGASMIVILF